MPDPFAAFRRKGSSDSGEPPARSPTGSAPTPPSAGQGYPGATIGAAAGRSPTGDGAQPPRAHATAVPRAGAASGVPPELPLDPSSSAERLRTELGAIGNNVAVLRECLESIEPSEGGELDSNELVQELLGALRAMEPRVVALIEGGTVRARGCAAARLCAPRVRAARGARLTARRALPAPRAAPRGGPTRWRTRAWWRSSSARTSSCRRPLSCTTRSSRTCSRRTRRRRGSWTRGTRAARALARPLPTAPRRLPATEAAGSTCSGCLTRCPPAPRSLRRRQGAARSTSSALSSPPARCSRPWRRSPQPRRARPRRPSGEQLHRPRRQASRRRLPPARARGRPPRRVPADLARTLSMRRSAQARRLTSRRLRRRACHRRHRCRARPQPLAGRMIRASAMPCRHRPPWHHLLRPWRLRRPRSRQRSSSHQTSTLSDDDGPSAPSGRPARQFTPA